MSCDFLQINQSIEFVGGEDAAGHAEEVVGGDGLEGLADFFVGGYAVPGEEAFAHGEALGLAVIRGYGDLGFAPWPCSATALTPLDSCKCETHESALSCVSLA